jgi:hypothetical protein
MEMFWVIVIIVAIVVIGFIANSVDEEKKKECKDTLDAKISKLPNRQSFKKIFGQNNRYAFILDNIGKVIYYMDTEQTSKVSFDQIISVEILEDNTLLSSKSTTRTIGGALLGGALAGGAGLVVGGLSGDSIQKKKVSKVLVKIKIRDYSTPSLTIPCFDALKLTGYNEIKTTDNLYGHFYKEELQNAQKIADYVSVIIDEVDRQEKKSTVANPRLSEKPSVADELAKLAKLKADGILTEEEFRAQKLKLLS